VADSKTGVPDLATLLDDGYVPLGGAANSLARKLPECATDEFMELFKTAVFDGEFDDRPEEIGETGVAWLKTASETSKRRYGFTRCSVVRMLLGADALPRDPAVREGLFDVIAIMTGEVPGYNILSRTPLNDYPERGRRELEALMVRRSVLANFLRSRYRVLSLVGTDNNPHQQPAFDVLPANQSCRRRIENPAHLRGRPRKASWPRIVQLVRQLASEHPDWQRKHLAFEAWNRAREEFSDSELASVATIQRSMVEIFDTGRR
jgi:hypothetical protein